MAEGRRKVGKTCGRSVGKGRVGTSYCWREHYQERGAPEGDCGRTQAEAGLIKTGQTQLNGKVMRLNHEARRPGINRSHSNIIQRGDSHSAVLPINIYVGDWITRILEIRN